MSRFLVAASVSISMAAAVSAAADDRFPSISNEAVRSECGDCHIVYQPQMLPQRSWRKLMDGLTDHFGEELSLDDDTRGEVLAYLLANSADELVQYVRDFRGLEDPVDTDLTLVWVD